MHTSRRIGMKPDLASIALQISVLWQVIPFSIFGYSDLHLSYQIRNFHIEQQFSDASQKVDSLSNVSHNVIRLTQSDTSDCVSLVV